MPVLVLSGLLCILIAFVSYTYGVWAAWRNKAPKPAHVVALWVGFVGDALGTGLMAAQIGYYRLDVHGIIGTLGIAIMLVTAIWASVVSRADNPEVKAGFAKYALIAWVIWLIPFVDGLARRR